MINTGIVDETAPTIEEFILTPTTVDVGSGQQEVAFRLAVTDDTGIASASISLAEVGQYRITSWSSTGPPTAEGIYEGTFIIRGNIDPVILKPSISVEDLGGRSTSYSNRDTLPDGFTSSLRVENTGVVDTPPVLERFELSASTVDITDGPQTISVLLEASDPISDISSVSISISPFGSSEAREPRARCGGWSWHLHRNLGNPRIHSGGAAKNLILYLGYFRAIPALQQYQHSEPGACGDSF